MSAFDCTKKNTNLYTDELKCGSLIYYINCGIAFISLLLFISVNLVAVSIFYEYSLGETNNILSKTTSKPDVFFAMTKIFVTVIFVALDGDEDIHYILIITCNLFTFISMCLNFYYP
jgi:phosphatidylglycerophosphate synthase